jgi:hypothetical protein
MKSLIKKILLREFGESVTDYDTWLEGIYDWTINPNFEYIGVETIVYDENGNYLGYWDNETNSGIVVTETIN